MKYFYFLVVFFFIINDLYSQCTNIDAMSGVYSTYLGVESVFYNQAGLSGVENTEASVYYRNSYFMREMNTKSFALAINTNLGGFGAGFVHFGSPLYYYALSSLGYSKQLAKRLFAGIGFDFVFVHFGEGYGNSWAVTGNLGLIAEPFDNLFIGIHAKNPFNSKLSGSPDPAFETIFDAGVAYVFDKKLRVAVDVIKDIRYKPSVNAGIEYIIRNKLFIRVGGRSSGDYSFGMGYALKNFNLDIAFDRNIYLGLSSSVSVSYNFGEMLNKSKHEN